MSGPPRQRVVVAVLGGLTAFGPISTDLYLPGLPQVARSLDTSASTAQLTLSASILGLGVGQLVMGPLSDRFGRRRPLLIGLALFTLFSLGCAVADSAPVLIAMRLGQALGGSAGLVIARAVARDRFELDELSRVFGVLTAIAGVVPVLAPLVGGQLLGLGSWRLTFVVLAATGLALGLAAWAWVEESLDEAHRSPAGLRAVARSYV